MCILKGVNSWKNFYYLTLEITLPLHFKKSLKSIFSQNETLRFIQITFLPLNALPSVVSSDRSIKNIKWKEEFVPFIANIFQSCYTDCYARW